MSNFDDFLARPANRTPVFDLVLSYLDGKPARILEIGVARDLNPAARQSDGWSSVHFGHYIAQHGGHLDSVDISQSSLDNCAALIASLPVHPSHALHCCDGREFINQTTVSYDIVLLDGSDDANEMLQCFEVVKTRARFILCDDFQSKGSSLKTAYPNYHLFHWSNHAFEMGLYDMGAEWVFEETQLEELQR